jgi:hypothetical protein
MHSLAPTPQNVASSIWSGARHIKAAIEVELKRSDKKDHSFVSCLAVLTELENRTTPFDANQRPRADVMMALLDAASYLRRSGQYERLVGLITQVSSVMCGIALGFAVGELAQAGDPEMQRIWAKPKPNSQGSQSGSADDITAILTALAKAPSGYPQSIAPVLTKWLTDV